VFFFGGKSDLNCGLIKGQPRVFKKCFGSEIFEEREPLSKLSTLLTLVRT